MREIGDHLASAGYIAGSVQASLSAPSTIDGDLVQRTSLTGGPNSPATPAYSNEPGLDTNGGKFNMQKHWVWILAIVLILAALWYYNPGNILGR